MVLKLCNCIFLFRFDWFFGEEELIGAELNKMNGVIITGVNPFTRFDTFNKVFTTRIPMLVKYDSYGIKRINKYIYP